MKTKKKQLLVRAHRGLSLTAALLMMTGATLFGEKYELEDHRIEWSGSMPMSTHTGLLSPQSLDIIITDDGTIESLKAVIDMDSIDVTDLEGKDRAKLMEHLRSEDFFFVEKYPTAMFDLKQHTDGTLKGTITIRGIAEPIVLPVDMQRDPDQGWILKGSFTFDRQKFDVNYQNGGFFGVAKDKLIRDEVKMDIELKVTKA